MVGAGGGGRIAIRPYEGRFFLARGGWLWRAALCTNAADYDGLTVTTTLRPYPAYRPSGVPWLGDVPAHWEVRRLKHWVGINEVVLPETTEPDFEFRYLEIGMVGTGVLVDEPVRIRFANAPSRARRIVRTGDTIFSTVRTYLKATWFAEEVSDALICSTGFAVLTPRGATSHKFVSYLAQSNPITDRVTAESVGTAYPAIPGSRFSSFHVPLPPVSEQRAIVRYLDHADRGIRGYVSAKRRLVELLEEERQAVINQAVTRGLDPNVRLRPSGVEWLGDVPAHWEVRRLKNHVANVVHLTSESSHDDIYLALEHVESWTGKFAAAGDDVNFDSQVKRFRAGDVLFGKLRPYLAKVTYPNRSGVCVGEFLVLRSSVANLSSRYLEQLLRSKSVIDAIDASTFGAKMPRANWQFIGNMNVPLPPLSEQGAIVEYVDRATGRIDAAAVRARRQIELLEEYRVRLIADAVTGKLDVREAGVSF